MQEPLEVVVGPTGQTTAAWTGQPHGRVGYLWPHVVRVANDPPLPGDPNSPPEPPNPQNQLDAQRNPQLAPARLTAVANEDLFVDATGRQTLMWSQDLLPPPGPYHDYTEFYDVVVSDRVPGGTWTSAPTVLTSFISGPHLAVNASGAGVMVWEDYGRPHFRTYASYRAAHGTVWTRPRRVLGAKYVSAVGIDDAGRALLLYDTRKDGLTAARRARGGHWRHPTDLDQRADFAPHLAVGANGAAVVSYTRSDNEGDNKQPFTVSMSPRGHWGPPVHQPGVRNVMSESKNRGFGPVDDRQVDMDARGRALLVWWDGTDVVARWSRPGGRWRKPCVLASNVPHPVRDDLDLQVAVNRRGDALVTWSTKGRRSQIWARYQRAGDAWSDPVRVTSPGHRPRRLFAAALGDGGHVAVAWLTGDGHQVVVRRAFPRTLAPDSAAVQ